VRGALIVGGALALVLVAGAAATATGLVTPPWTAAAASESPAPTAEASEVRTATVERRSMQTAAELDGTLGYEGALAVAAGRAGTVTRVPDAGDVIERGEVLYELDGKVRPRLLYGDRPL